MTYPNKILLEIPVEMFVVSNTSNLIPEKSIIVNLDKVSDIKNKQQPKSSIDKPKRKCNNLKTNNQPNEMKKQLDEDSLVSRSDILPTLKDKNLNDNVIKINIKDNKVHIIFFLDSRTIMPVK
jgi:LAS superfamily LD-carboxypeptidase LdcB